MDTLFEVNYVDMMSGGHSSKIVGRFKNADAAVEYAKSKTSSEIKYSQKTDAMPTRSTVGYLYATVGEYQITAYSVYSTADEVIKQEKIAARSSALSKLSKEEIAALAELGVE